jgi:hypothetical protein
VPVLEAGYSPRSTSLSASTTEPWKQVRMVGFEPTFSGNPSRRITRLSHILNEPYKSPELQNSPHCWDRGAGRNRTYSFGLQPNLSSL